MAKQGQIRVDEIDEKTIESCLYTSHLPQPSPDLILRTSGEKRLSGFLIWQSAYSELMFMDVFWPEFRKIDLMRAIRTYQHRVSQTWQIIRYYHSIKWMLLFFQTRSSEKFLFDFFNLPVVVNIETNDFCREFP